MLNAYLPEIKAKGKQLDRTFFFNVINTLYPHIMPKILSEARALRFKVDEDE